MPRSRASCPTREPHGAFEPNALAQAALVDSFGRTLDYLRIAVNEVCNLRCIYCMPAEGLAFRTGPDLLSDDEIVRIVTVVAKLGVSKVRLTGGEPLLRPGLPELIARLKAIPGIVTCALTTNGTRLAKLAPALRAAGLDGVNVSIDTLRAERSATITRRARLADVLAGLDAAIAAGIRRVKVNVVVMDGLNADEIPDFIDVARQRPIGLRFIELMPFDVDQVWRRGHFFSAERIRDAVVTHAPELVPVRGSTTEHEAFGCSSWPGSVAIIPAFTRNLCGQCNRLRLTADGALRTCLYSKRELSLRDLLREGASDAEIAAMFRHAAGAKARDGWTAAREPATEQGHRPSMTQIGG